MRAAKIYLILISVFSIAVGLIYLIAPSVMLTPFGFGELRPSALTDARANYGGFQIGTGLFMLFCLPSPRRKLGMLLALLLGVTITISRAIGMAVDGDVIGPVVRALVLETVLTLVPLVIYLRMPSSGTSERGV